MLFCSVKPLSDLLQVLHILHVLSILHILHVLHIRYYIKGTAQSQDNFKISLVFFFLAFSTWASFLLVAQSTAAIFTFFEAG